MIGKHLTDNMQKIVNKILSFQNGKRVRLKLLLSKRLKNKKQNMKKK